MTPTPRSGFATPCAPPVSRCGRPKRAQGRRCLGHRDPQADKNLLPIHSADLREFKSPGRGVFPARMEAGGGPGVPVAGCHRRHARGGRPGAGEVLGGAVDASAVACGADRRGPRLSTSKANRSRSRGLRRRSRSRTYSKAASESRRAIRADAAAAIRFSAISSQNGRVHRRLPRGSVEPKNRAN